MQSPTVTRPVAEPTNSIPSLIPGSIRSALPSLLFLGLVAGVPPIGTSAHVPALTQIAGDFGCGYHICQLTVTAYMVGYCISMFFSGVISDLVGKRTATRWALAISAIACYCASAAPSIECLVLARVVQALGAGALLVIPYAVVQNLLSGAALLRALALIGIYHSIGSSLAPLIGGAVASAAGWRAVFLLCGVFSTALLFWSKTAMPAFSPPVRTRKKWSNVSAMNIWNKTKNLISSRKFQAYAAVLAAGSAIYYGFLAAGPVLMVTKAGLSVEEFGFIMSAFCAFFPFGNYLAPICARRWGSTKVLIGGASLGLAGMLSMFALSGELSPAALMIPMAVYAVAYGMVSPLAVSGGTRIDASMAGNASSLLFSFQLLIGSIASWVVGIADLSSARAFSLLCSATIIVMLTAILVAVSGRKTQAS
jgi:Arabinose efflux permease